MYKNTYTHTLLYITTCYTYVYMYLYMNDTYKLYIVLIINEKNLIQIHLMKKI